MDENGVDLHYLCSKEIQGVSLDKGALGFPYPPDRTADEWAEIAWEKTKTWETLSRFGCDMVNYGPRKVRKRPFVPTHCFFTDVFGRNSYPKRPKKTLFNQRSYSKSPIMLWKKS